MSQTTNNDDLQSGICNLPLSRRDFLAYTAAGAASGCGVASRALGQTEPALPQTPRPNAPLAMWALTGELKSADVLRQLDAFRDVGWGVVLYPRWGLELEYLGEAYFERIRYIVEQADARAMEVWLYDEFAWPSGHAKGLVTKDHEELSAEVLQIDQDGQNRIARAHGNANLLLPEATQRFLQITHERYASAIGPYFGRCVRAIFSDEPSMHYQHHGGRSPDKATWNVMWSKSMEAVLGEDFRRRLAEAEDVQSWPGWRDYWAAYTQVFHNAWVSPITRWCQAHNIAMSGHLLGEGHLGSQVAYNGSLRRQLVTFGIPGIDEIYTRTNPANCEAMTLAAIAEMSGRERMAELYALGPCYLKLGTMRKMLDLCAACGVDRYVLAICPHDLRGGVFKREYLGVHGHQQPWFKDYAKIYTEHVAEAADRARTAKPLGITWPSDETLWAAAGPDPLSSKALAAMSQKLVVQARQAIASRLSSEPLVGPTARNQKTMDLVWSLRPQNANSLRLDGPTLDVLNVPSSAELSVQSLLVRSLRINGTAVDYQAAPHDKTFDISYRRVQITHLLQSGKNHFEINTGDMKSLRFLPAVILWGDFAVDPQGRLIALPTTTPLGDWRQHGYPSLCGTGRYAAVADFATLPTRLVVETGGYPAAVWLNGKLVGRCAWPPFDFDVRGVARVGHNEITIDVTSTVGHLFIPTESPPVGLLKIGFEF